MKNLSYIFSNFSIEEILKRYNNIVLIIFVLLCFCIIISNLSVATTGALILLMGIFYYYYGYVLYSTIFYIMADLCWALMAYDAKDIIGMICIVLSIIIGTLVVIKMNKGIFVKTLFKD